MFPSYLASFSTDELPRTETDVLVVGSGIAGLTAALSAPKGCKIILISKSKLDECATSKAQGGIAAVVSPKDSAISHFKDTVAAGAGLCDENAVRILVTEAKAAIRWLVKTGMRFDRTKGSFDFGLEGGHSAARILHSHDSTGNEVEKALIAAAKSKKNIQLLEEIYCVDLVIYQGRCRGAIVSDKKGRLFTVSAKAVIMATGGAGQLFTNTTNPKTATGDGIAIAYRAGAAVSDVEFIQFHPTALFKKGVERFLITEGMRGAGAKLVNAKGVRFMKKYDKMAELAPRDIVARAIKIEMENSGSDCVYLDATGIKKVAEKFPLVYKTCMEYGIDISKEKIPIAPAAHYIMGGITTDMRARTNIPGLFACGECACTGVHGANRLASNSLLEGLVFGRRAGKTAASMAANLRNLPSFSIKSERPEKQIEYDAPAIRKAMDKGCWIVRSAESMRKCAAKLEKMEEFLNYDSRSISGYELQNMLVLSKLIIESALAREESRGAHQRSDFPEKDDVNWNRRIRHVNAET
ncbi:MAG: L-aspartate oxidase [Candidatus Thermoplasmatota archaeon]|nr:L-aspartate oxidase [Candidatus Thermoplasmatota archaeon]